MCKRCRVKSKVIYSKKDYFFAKFCPFPPIAMLTTKFWYYMRNEAVGFLGCGHTISMKTVNKNR